MAQKSQLSELEYQMTDTVMKRKMRTPAEFWRDVLAHSQEAAILDVTEKICELMQAKGVSREELAKKLGTTTSSLTKTLDGRQNMTIRYASDILWHLGYKFRIEPIAVVDMVFPS